MEQEAFEDYKNTKSPEAEKEAFKSQKETEYPEKSPPTSNPPNGQLVLEADHLKEDFEARAKTKKFLKTVAFVEKHLQPKVSTENTTEISQPNLKSNCAHIRILQYL